MTKIGCPCGNLMPDNTDFLPYKAKFIADEDTQIPVEVLAKSIVALFAAPDREGRRAFLIDYLPRFGNDSDAMIDLVAR